MDDKTTFLNGCFMKKEIKRDKILQRHHCLVEKTV